MIVRVCSRLRDFKNFGDVHRKCLLNLPRSMGYRKDYSTSFENEKKVASNDPKEDFEVVYKFNHIVIARYISRLKIYQTCFTVACVPINYVLYSYEMVPLATCWRAVGISAFASVMLGVISQLSQRIIGLVSVNDDLSIVRLSHLSFFGKRKNIFLPLEDIVPLTDIGEEKDDIYAKVKLFSDFKFVMYLPMKHGIILNRKAFGSVFGLNI